jgi:hypothetical protein
MTVAQLVAKLNQLEQENAKLRDENTQLKSALAKQQAQHMDHALILEKLQKAEAIIASLKSESSSEPEEETATHIKVSDDHEAELKHALANQQVKKDLTKEEVHSEPSHSKTKLVSPEQMPPHESERAFSPIES